MLREFWIPLQSKIVVIRATDSRHPKFKYAYGATDFIPREAYSRR